MSIITVHRSPRASGRTAACATRLERLLLRTAAGITSLVEHRMDRRTARRTLRRLEPSVRMHDELRADAASTLHLGILPR